MFYGLYLIIKVFAIETIVSTILSLTTYYIDFRFAFSWNSNPW